MTTSRSSCSEELVHLRTDNPRISSSLRKEACSTSSMAGQGIIGPVQHVTRTHIEGLWSCVKAGTASGWVQSDYLHKAGEVVCEKRIHLRLADHSSATLLRAAGLPPRSPTHLQPEDRVVVWLKPEDPNGLALVELFLVGATKIGWVRYSHLHTPRELGKLLPCVWCMVDGAFYPKDGKGECAFVSGVTGVSGVFNVPAGGGPVGDAGAECFALLAGCRMLRQYLCVNALRVVVVTDRPAVFGNLAWEVGKGSGRLGVKAKDHPFPYRRALHTLLDDLQDSADRHGMEYDITFMSRTKATEDVLMGTEQLKHDWAPDRCIKDKTKRRRAFDDLPHLPQTHPEPRWDIQVLHFMCDCILTLRVRARLGFVDV